MSTTLRICVPALLACVVFACTPTSEPLNDVDGGATCRERAWYPDADGDGVGEGTVPTSACEAPAGFVSRGGDNCPWVQNPGQEDSDGDSAGDACEDTLSACGDLTEESLDLFAARGGSVSLITGANDRLQGARALRLTATGGDASSIRWMPGGHVDLRGFDTLRFAVRGHNTNTGAWQVAGPVIIIEDALGMRRTLQPSSNLLSSDGATWTAVNVPLSGGGGFVASGASVDLGRVRSVDVVADTWGAGFTLDVDAWAFQRPGQSCTVSCPMDCSGQGTCDPTTLRCACDLGATGASCDTCEDGFVRVDGHCVPPNDIKTDAWPNDASRVNGDAWLRAHHDEIRVLRPRVVVLDFVNTSTPARTAELVESIVDGFAEASRPNGAGTPQLQYQVTRTMDLRDGTGGRAPAPAGWPYQNSTLYPRRPASESGAWRFDYATLFSPAFAPHLGITDPSAPGTFMDLCTAVESGAIHELWIVSSGDVPDAGMAEVLEHKQRYTPGGHAIPGSFDACAGNGCFDADVPRCARSIRIGTINYSRGPGCYLHSIGHGMEGAAQRQVVPDFSSWFLPFAGFDLDERHGLPVKSLYGLTCTDADNNGQADSRCVEWLSNERARLHHQGTAREVNPFDPACGNVHFPPNAGWHYEYDVPTEVLSRCASFGRQQVTRSPVTSAAWRDLEARTPDCGGGFLTWWFRRMPGGGTGHVTADGTPMKSAWPFLFY